MIIKSDRELELEGKLDAIKADLVKFVNTTKEAAEVMLKSKNDEVKAASLSFNMDAVEVQEIISKHFKGEGL